MDLFGGLEVLVWRALTATVAVVLFLILRASKILLHESCDLELALLRETDP